MSIFCGNGELYILAANRTERMATMYDCWTERNIAVLSPGLQKHHRAHRRSTKTIAFSRPAYSICRMTFLPHPSCDTIMNTKYWRLSLTTLSLTVLFLGVLFCVTPLFGQEASSIVTETNYSALKLRNIGPAFTSGRIADIAMHPEDDNLWYVAVGSGGVWKTVNAGTTWESLFDGQGSYSIGAITLDPNNPHIIWVGTGENVGGRHVAYGDGIYRSTDGGSTWKNMGLKDTEHISRIIVHPQDSDIVWVAAQGPLWASGGERGLYKTTDGGETWTRTLGDDEWVGTTDVVIDSRNPDVLYAATWQRHRNVAAYMGGGPGSGIHKSTDGGTTWTPSTKGIPNSNLGKIGLAISYHNPDHIYAAIELDRTSGGIFMSSDRGASWTKMSDAVSGATGPHYYQELYTTPHAEGRLYLMDVRVQNSDDHGKNFRRLTESDKHSDNHAIAFRLDDPDYILMGTDGGLFESFDDARTWRFIANLPHHPILQGRRRRCHALL